VTARSTEPTGANLPVLRALHRPRFRIVLALTLIVIGVSVHVFLWAIAMGYSGTDAGDFNAYLSAAERAQAGSSPYESWQLGGAFHSITSGAYLYPPPLAQILTLVVSLPESLTSAVWYVLQAVSVYAAVWLGTGLGGASRSLERVLWSLVAVLLFLPVFNTLWWGNTGGLIALGATLVAVGGTAAGVSAALMTMLKVSPAAFIPAVLVMGGRARISLVVVLAAVAAGSFLLQPEWWFDFFTVLENLAAGATDDRLNLAPANVAERGGLPEAVVVATRLSTFVVAGGAALASMYAARKPGGYPAAALMGTITMLLVPGSIWYHYLVVLLPFAAMAWPQAGLATRVGLVVSATLVSIGMTLEPVALGGAIAMTVIAVPVLWAQVGRDPSSDEPADLE
jgi:hypothetical protein